MHRILNCTSWYGEYPSFVDQYCAGYRPSLVVELAFYETPPGTSAARRRRFSWQITVSMASMLCLPTCRPCAHRRAWGILSCLKCWSDAILDSFHLYAFHLGYILYILHTTTCTSKYEVPPIPPGAVVLVLVVMVVVIVVEFVIVVVILLDFLLVALIYSTHSTSSAGTFNSNSF